MKVRSKTRFISAVVTTGVVVGLYVNGSYQYAASAGAYPR